MSKPVTTYTASQKATSGYDEGGLYFLLEDSNYLLIESDGTLLLEQSSNPVTSYAETDKPATSFSRLDNTETNYGIEGRTASVSLDSTLVTLGSTAVRLHGRTTTTFSQSGKIKTTYEEL